MNKKKRIMIAVMAAFVLISIIGALVLLFEKDDGDVFVSSFVYNSDYKPKSHIFFEPEQDADIFADPDYQKAVPFIYYERDGIKKCITDENYAPYGAVVEFFGEYFDALKAGDTDKFNSMHSQRYFAHNREYIDIAPQRLYDITIEYIFEKDMTDPDYGEVTKYVYEVSYKIMKNDGTFRNDIGSDGSRPLYLEIVETSDTSIFVDACGDEYNMPE